MAERRMFAKSIVTSDAFLDMPATARCLYFTLAMFADDDGFVNSPKSIMRQVGSTTDDMNILVSKKFVIAFDSGVIVIKHWRIHNYIRGDRKHETKYLDELSTLDLEENGAYTQKSEPMELLEQDDAKTMRQKAYAESELPYSFDYKIRQAFWNKKCPVCGVTMNSEYLCKPTIQHNIPISKGGKHELGNISVICQKCNASIRNNETDKLNAEEVIEVWEDICRASDNQTTVNGKPRLGKVSIGKDSIGKVRSDKERIDEDSLDNCCSSGAVDFMELLTLEEIEYLKTVYEDVYELMDEAGADATKKRKKIGEPFAYLVGYATNKGWVER